MLTYRKFDKENDYNIMRHIVQDNCVKTGHLYPQLHIGNLDFERFSFEESPDILYKTTYFVLNNNMEIGFISAYEDEFFITILSEFECFTEDILNYIEHNCYTHEVTITTDANSNNLLLSNILEQHGYSKTGNYRFNGICDLSKILPYVPLPTGYSIRLTEKKDINRRAELYGLATGGVQMPPVRYESLMNAPSYDDAMYLVVETDKAEVIAYCTIWNDPVSKIAILEPVACVAEHRHKGIMKSTLLYGMNKVKSLGTKYIYVGTGGKNVASQALYKSVGFLEYGKNYEWQKTL